MFQTGNPIFLRKLQNMFKYRFERAESGSGWIRLERTYVPESCEPGMKMSESRFSSFKKDIQFVGVIGDDATSANNNNISGNVIDFLSYQERK